MMSKVLIIGLGQLGLPVARYVKEKGFDTYGYDIDSNAMEIAERTAGIKQARDFSSTDFDVFIISVSTHKQDDMFSPQYRWTLVDSTENFTGSKKRWCFGFNRKHYFKRNIKEGI